MELCNWLIKKKKEKEIQKKLSGATIFIGLLRLRVRLVQCCVKLHCFHPINFLSWMLFKNNNTSFVPQFGNDLLVISRGLWKLPGFYLYVIDTNFWIWFMYWKLVGLSDPLDPGALTALKVLCWIRVEPIPLLLRTVLTAEPQEPGTLYPPTFGTLTVQ